MLDESGIHATVAVQARQSLEETEWLLGLAAESSWIEGVVGWVPLVDSDVETTIERLSSNKRLRGVRHVLQAEPDAFMERDDFNAGLKILSTYGLTYDLLVLEQDVYKRQVLQMFSHGVLAGLLFATVGRIVYERTHTRDLGVLSKLQLGKAMPFAAWLFVIAGMASMGLPGFSGFVAEVQVLMAAGIPIAAWPRDEALTAWLKSALS